MAVKQRKKLKEPDEFITLSDRAVRWARENLKLVIALAAAFVLCLAAITAVQAYLQHQRQAAAQALAVAMEPYAKAMDDFTDQKSFTAAEKALRKVMEDYGSTASGVQASLSLGNLLLSREKWGSAQEVFQVLCEQDDLAPILQPLAWRGKAQALEGQKKFQESAGAYRRAVKLSGPNLARRYRLDLARVLAAAGDQKQAEDIYRELCGPKGDPLLAEVARAELVELGVVPPKD